MNGFFRKIGLTALAFVSFVLLFLDFQSNRFGVATDDFFGSFQKDSEALVIGNIVANQRIRLTA